ncbi:MAG: GPW/gp25 family protein [Lachnospiraceae bacterium]|nr:GPW/gp25 family protein [Lachnospiraceae bacterium]
MTEPEKVRGFLGIGFHFPIQVEKATGKMKTVSLEEDIMQAIPIILMTRKGERVMRPDFGCDIHDFAFDTTDYTTLMQMENAVRDALIHWEPRIKDIQVHINDRQKQEGTLLIEISYLVRSTNNPFNLVYPYYINEGMGA